MSSFTYDFEELSLCDGYDEHAQPVALMALVSGKAEIGMDRTGWLVTTLWLDPAFTKPGQPKAYSIPLQSPLGLLILNAIDKHCEAEIDERIGELEASARDDAAEYAGEMRREDALLARGDWNSAPTFSGGDY